MLNVLLTIDVNVALMLPRCCRFRRLAWYTPAGHPVWLPSLAYLSGLPAWLTDLVGLFDLVEGSVGRLATFLVMVHRTCWTSSRIPLSRRRVRRTPCRLPGRGMVLRTP